MTRSEVAAALRLILFNRHVWVAKPNQFNLGAFFGENRALF
jgi:hypothetical protein